MGRLLNVNIHNGPSHQKIDTGDYRRATDSDWAAFNASIRFDAPVPEVVGLLHSIRPGIVRIMVSGRAEGQIGKTDLRIAMLDWIHKHSLPIDQIFMRQAGDRRVDSEVKEEILLTKILPFYRPVLAVDDRPQVLEVWERYGIPVIKVNNPGKLPFIAFQGEK